MCCGGEVGVFSMYKRGAIRIVISKRPRSRAERLNDEFLVTMLEEARSLKSNEGFCFRTGRISPTCPDMRFENGATTELPLLAHTLELTFKDLARCREKSLC